MILMILKTWMSRMIMRGLRITRGRGATSSSRFMSCMQVEEGADAEYADDILIDTLSLFNCDAINSCSCLVFLLLVTDSATLCGHGFTQSQRIKWINSSSL